MVWSTDSSSFLSGYSGRCKAFLDFQLSSVHFPVTAAREGAAAVAAEAAAGFLPPPGTEFLGGSAAWTAEIRGTDLGWWVGLVGKKEREGWWECEGVDRG